jgi:hypothetical protein
MEMLREHICRSLQFNLNYALELIRDIPEGELLKSAGPGLENHAIFTLGHLLTALGLTIKYLGHPYDVPDEWDELFRRKGPGDPRLPERDVQRYPELSALVRSLKEKTHLLSSLINELSEEELKKEVTWRYAERYPYLYDLLAFMCIEHYAMHLGQLAGWRRAKGYDSALQKL